MRTISSNATRPGPGSCLPGTLPSISSLTLGIALSVGAFGLWHACREGALPAVGLRLAAMHLVIGTGLMLLSSQRNWSAVVMGGSLILGVGLASLAMPASAWMWIAFPAMVGTLTLMASGHGGRDEHPGR